MDNKDQDREPVFHERVNVLREHGYNGFTITNTKEKWGGTEVTAKNASGKVVSASGETNEEAYKKIIDQIDQVLDEPQ